jgi:hypothetical protein
LFLSDVFQRCRADDDRGAGLRRLFLDRRQLLDIDGAGAISSENEDKQPSHDRDTSPEPANDIDESEGGPGDLMAANSLRTGQSTSGFSVTGIDPATLRMSRILRFVLLPVNCFLCSREHAGERAPPTSV